MMFESALYGFGFMAITLGGSLLIFHLVDWFDKRK